MERPPLISRRSLLLGSGAAGLAGISSTQLLAATALARAPATGGLPTAARSVLTHMCLLTPSQTEGPYYFNAGLVRRDIKQGKPGLPVTIYYMVVQASSCAPIAGALVDIWHADHTGTYSGYTNQGTQGQTWLRGIQATDANGIARFDTVFPGWYPTRTTHVHVKVHLPSGAILTTQTYFDDGLPDLAYRAIAPYSSRGVRQTTNRNDPIGVPTSNVKAVVANPDGSLSLVAGLILGVA